MPKLGYKTLKAAIAVIASLITVAPAPAIASPAAFSPASAASVAGSSPASAASVAAFSPASAASVAVPKRLKSALLAERNLPGFQLLFDDAGILVADINADATFCDQRPSAKPSKAEVAEISFVKDDFGPVLIENLTATGPAAARAVVAGLAAAPRKCPTLKLKLFGEPATMKLSPLRVPRLGEAAAGVGFTLKLPGLKSPAPGTLIAVAHHGVVLNILIVGDERLSPSRTNAVVTTAVGKLQRIR